MRCQCSGRAFGRAIRSIQTPEAVVKALQARPIGGCAGKDRWKEAFMNALLHPIVAVVVCVAAAVCFGAAARIHAMDPTEPSAPDSSELSVAAALAASHKAWSALDFWIP